MEKPKFPDDLTFLRGEYERYFPRWEWTMRFMVTRASEAEKDRLGEISHQLLYNRELLMECRRYYDALFEAGYRRDAQALKAFIAGILPHSL